MKKFIFAAVLPVLHIFGVIDASAAIPYFTDEAVRSVDRSTVQSEGKALLDELGRELPAYEKSAGNETVLLRRLELLRRGMELLERNLEATDSPELICYAAVAIEELRRFQEYFREIITRSARPPLPVKVINVTDFGAAGDGVTDNSEPFRKALAHAMSFRDRYACTIMIPDGTFYFANPRMGVPFRADYLVPPEKGGGLDKIRKTNGYIVIGNQKNLTVAGSGNTELLFDRPLPGVSCIKLGACDNVTVKDLFIDYKMRPFTQGTITEINAQEGSVVLQSDDPEAAMPGMAHFRRGHMWSFTPEGTFQWEHGFFMMKKAEKAGPLAVRYFFGDDRGGNFNPVPLSAGREAVRKLRPGMKMVHVSRVHGGGVQLDFCRFSTIENVTVYASQAMAFLDTNGYADSFISCNIRRRPGRMISTNGDGFHLASPLFGSAMVNCRGEYLYDDGLNTYSRHALVEKQLLSGGWSVSDIAPFPSSLVGVVNQETGQITALARCSRLPDRSYQLSPAVPLVSREMIRAGNGNGRQLPDSLICFSRNGTGFVAIDTSFENHHGKSFMIQSPHSLVENCSSVNAHQAGFHVGTMGNWCEYTSPHNVILRKNRTEGGKHGLMIFYMLPGNRIAGCNPLRDILLEDNSFQNCRSGRPVLLHNIAQPERR